MRVPSASPLWGVAGSTLATIRVSEMCSCVSSIERTCSKTKRTGRPKRRYAMRNRASEKKRSGVGAGGPCGGAPVRRARRPGGRGGRRRGAEARRERPRRGFSGRVLERRLSGHERERAETRESRDTVCVCSVARPRHAVNTHGTRTTPVSVPPARRGTAAPRTRDSTRARRGRAARRRVYDYDHLDTAVCAETPPTPRAAPPLSTHIYTAALHPCGTAPSAT